MSELFDIPLSEQIECIERELKLRQSVYARRIAQGKMTVALAERETGRMRAVLNTLIRVRDGLRLPI